MEDATVVRALYRGIEEEDVPALAIRRPGGRVDTPDGHAPPLRRHAARLAGRPARRVSPRRGGDGPRVSAETFLKFGDGVLVVGRFISAAGTEPFLHECFVRGGKVIRIREYPAGTVKRSEGDG